MNQEPKIKGGLTEVTLPETDIAEELKIYQGYLELGRLYGIEVKRIEEYEELLAEGVLTENYLTS